MWRDGCVAVESGSPCVGYSPEAFCCTLLDCVRAFRQSDGVSRHAGWERHAGNGDRAWPRPPDAAAAEPRRRPSTSSAPSFKNDGGSCRFADVHLFSSRRTPWPRIRLLVIGEFSHGLGGPAREVAEVWCVRGVLTVGGQALVYVHVGAGNDVRARHPHCVGGRRFP